MKLRVLLLASILYFEQASGQADAINKYINNDSIRYGVLMTMPDFEGGEFISKYLCIIKSLDSSGKSLVRSLSRKQWMRLLNDSTADWAANLILHAMYERSAYVFYRSATNREHWVRHFREDHLAYWKSFLKKKRYRKYRKLLVHRFL